MFYPLFSLLQMKNSFIFGGMCTDSNIEELIILCWSVYRTNTADDSRVCDFSNASDCQLDVSCLIIKFLILGMFLIFDQIELSDKNVLTGLNIYQTLDRL